MELLRDGHPQADSKHTAQECHHVEKRRHSKKKVPEQLSEQMLYLRTRLQKSINIFISSINLSLVFKIHFLQLNFTCFTLSLQPLSLPDVYHINSKTQPFQRPFSVRLWEKSV